VGETLVGLFVKNILKKINVKTYYKRFVLYSLTAVMAFTITQPAEVAALGFWEPEKGTNFADALPVDEQSEEIQSQQVLIDDETARVQEEKSADRTIVGEDTSKRKAYSSVYRNKDGTRTMKFSSTQKNFREDGKWKAIDNSLEPEKAEAPERSLWDIVTFQKQEAPAPEVFDGEAGSIEASMQVFTDGTELAFDDKKLTIKPVDANDVKPKQKDDRSVIYKNAWHNVDAEYQLRGETVKEVLIVKDKDAPTSFDFKVEGGSLVKHPTRDGELAIEGVDPDKYSFSALTLDVNGRGIISEKRVTQYPTSHGMRVELDKDWVKSLPASSFPLRIDPSFYRFNTDGGAIFKSDGYSCNPANCYYNTGTLNDNGWKHWRSYFNFNYNQLSGGKKVLNARLQLPMERGVNGDESNRQIKMSWANCISFNCVGQGAVASATTGLVADLDFTSILQARVNGNDYSGWFGIWGEEGPYKSYKPFYEMHIDVVYDTPTPTAPLTFPADKQVVTDTQPTLRVNPVTDGDGESVNYRYRVSTSASGSGVAINSAWSSQTQWTIPEGVLQDGTTYYWRADTKGTSSTGTETLGTTVRSFKVDLRKGKDSTQSFETVGPMGVDLATGNTTTSETTHSMSALGGDIGLTLNYDTVTESSKGLLGKYWNISSSYGSGVPTTTPKMQRNDKEVNFDWAAGNPGGGIANDYTYAQWTGYFVPPTTGSYKFGTINDDFANVWVNDQRVTDNGICSSVCYGSSVTLSAGKPVKFEVRFREATGNSYMKLYVKGAVPQQIIPRDWLRTPVLASKAAYGLKGYYYNYTDNKTFPSNSSDPNRLMMVRNDTKLSFNWASGGPAQGLQKDKFLVRWTGHITAPTSGSYTLGVDADDGAKIKTNTGLLGAQQTIYDMWGGQSGTKWGNAINLTAGQPVAITVEYFEGTGDADFRLLIKGADLPTAGVEVPEKWLTPEADVLPDGWKLGIDASGAAYDRLRPAGNNIILEDSSGGTYEYTWTGSGYKPPKDQNGYLTRNTINNTYTLIDTDGRQYVFNASGKLIELTTPEDDKQPAALKYTYDGDPIRLVRITDGVNDDRYGELFYKDVNDTGDICDTPTGFDDAPYGMLCAFRTTDGDITNLHYKDDMLSRIQKPGNELDDYGYDALGRISSIRDSVANDAIAYNVRQNDETVLTELKYDELGRIESVKAPGAEQAVARNDHTFTYKDSILRPIYRFYKHSAGEHTTTTRPLVSGYSLEERHGYLLATQEAGTVPIYECRVNSDNFISRSSTCEGQEVIGMHGYIYTSAQPGTVALYRCKQSNSQHFTSRSSNCEGQISEGNQGYILTSEGSSGNTRLHIEGASEPHGFSKRIEYDSLLRTTKETNLANLSTTTVWDSTKDMVRSVTDATGLKSTTIYDSDDRAIEQYGAAPSAWFGSDNKPLAAHLNSVPRTSTGYDEGLNGPAVSWYDVRGDSLVGSPRLNTLGVDPANPEKVSRDGTTLPVTKQSGFDGVGMRASGNIYVPTTGTYTFSASHDDALRIWVNDNLVIDKWTNRSDSVTSASGTATLTANQPNRVMLEYANYGTGRSAFSLDLAGNSQNTTGSVWGAKWKPGYGLATSRTAYDSEQGDLTTQTVYKNPSYGQVEKAVLDPSGLGYESKAEFESPGSGLLRQTSKTLPGGTRTEYLHYGAADTRDNPCTEEIETFRQAGRAKSIIEADPDGSGPELSRTSETVYDESGAAVATRYNDDAWTCTDYDTRGRVTQTIVPARVEGGRTVQGRTITNNYAVDNNPLKINTSDNSGTIIVLNDLLGRTVSYTDAKGKVTHNEYDDFGKLISRTSPIGTESYGYDTYDRLITHKLDGATFATVSYDQYSRINGIQYAAGISLSSIGRDALGRESSDTFTLAGGQVLTDQIERYVSGDIKQGAENGIAKSYQYDNIGRLVGATIGENTYSYEFSSPDESCSNVPGYNAATARNGNRTKLTINGVSTTYCYDTADRLVSSSDATLTDAQYDSHGNTVSLGDSSHRTEFAYDAGDRNVSVKSGGKESAYTRDVQGRIIEREQKENGDTVGAVAYGFTGASDTPDFLLDAEGNIKHKYVLLPGDVLATIKTDSQSAGATTFSLPNIHGDVFATVNADGALMSTHISGPFGESLPVAPTQPQGATAPMESPSNTEDGTTWGYLGQHEKLNEIEVSPIDGGVMQMGARVYLPTLGRFLQVDPVDGGTDNTYTYANDPVNQADITGNAVETIVDAAAIGYDAYQLYDKPSWGNAGLLAWSVAATLVPFVPGSYVYRAGKAIKAAEPKMTKKATTVVPRKAVVPRIAAVKERIGGYTSPVFGNPTLRNPYGVNAGRSGILNNKSSPVRVGWSVARDKHQVMRPVFRISIQIGGWKWHINIKFGRFYR